MEEFKSLDSAQRVFAIPEGESSTQQAAIDMVHLKPSIGHLTWLRGFRHPFYGFPAKDNVMGVGDVKQMIPAFARFCFKKPMRYVLGLLFLFFPKSFDRLVNDAIDSFLSMAWNSYQRFLLPPEKYTKAVKEIHRGLTALAISDDYLDLKGRIERLRDVGCMVLQYDNAYILRLQDGIGELDLKALKENPLKEIGRVLTIVADRDTSAFMKSKVCYLRNLVCMFLKRNKGYYQILQGLISTIDFEKLRLDVAERYYCRRRNDYDFAGHKAKKDKNYGLPTKMETIMEEAILQRLESRKTTVQQEFDKLVQQREKLIQEERKLEDRKEKINQEINQLEKSAEVMRGRFAEILEEETQLKQILEQDKKQKEKEASEEIKVA